LTTQTGVKTQIAPHGASDLAHIVMTFDNNHHARALFGQFDQNLALIEQMLGIDVRARGNQVTIKGDPLATEQARRALDWLYDRIEEGGKEPEASDVEGALRMAMAADDQLSLPTMDGTGRIAAAQIATRKRTIMARTPNQDAYMRALERAELSSASARRAPARPIWRLHMRSPCCSNAGRSNG
jgi:phosphate starvation-inducible PhoH-like protein